MAVYPPGTPRAFPTFDDALSASPHLRILRAMLKVGLTILCYRALQRSPRKLRRLLGCSKRSFAWASMKWHGLSGQMQGSSLQSMSRVRVSVQRLPSSYPCPVQDSNTNCTLFAVTDASWKALASFLGISISGFGQSPVIATVCILLIASWKEIPICLVGVSQISVHRLQAFLAHMRLRLHIHALWPSVLQCGINLV